MYRNCFRHSEQFFYTTCSPHVLQKEEILKKIYLYFDLEPSEQNFVNIKEDPLDQSVQFRYYNPLLTLIGGQNNSTLQGSTRTPASSFETGMKSAKPTPITSAQNSTQSSRTMSSFDVKSGKPTPSTSAQNSPMSLARICRSPTVNHPG